MQRDSGTQIRHIIAWCFVKIGCELIPDNWSYSHARLRPCAAHIDAARVIGLDEAVWVTTAISKAKSYSQAHVTWLQFWLRL